MEATMTGVYLCYTSNFFKTMERSQPLASVAGRITKDALNRALNTVKGLAGADFFIYKNGDPKENRKEDGGRTEIVHINGLPEKVYAVMDDYGDPAEWVNMYGEDIASDLKAALGNRRHKLTIMFSSDY